jgi:cyclophilin family peptidyl-prolyl cis-trans isomerase
MISAAALFLLTQVTTSSPAPAPVPSPRPTPSGPVVVLETSMGRIRIGLYDDKSPVSTENFLKYVRKGHYNGTIFHRVIPTFMIQGGGMAADMTEKPTDAPIRNEARNGVRNSRGTVAMARTNDPNSATAQFFINLKDNASLDFGRRLRRLRRGGGGHGGRGQDRGRPDHPPGRQRRRAGHARPDHLRQGRRRRRGAAGHRAAGVAASFAARDRAATRAPEPPRHSAAEPDSAPVNA